MPVDEAIRRASELVSRDNAMGPKLMAPLYLGMPDILQALKLSDRRDAATLTLRKGNRKWTVTVAAGAVDPPWPADTDISLVTPEGWVDARTGPQPIWLQAPLELHRMVALPQSNSLYIQLNRVGDLDGESLDQFGAKVLAQARAQKPRAVILDLRLNQGGNGDLRNGLVRDLIKIENDDTHLFVLTARGTFSASQFILDDLDRLSGAVFIGEPASSKPNSYGDAFRATLPNSGINVRSSIFWWQTGQGNDPWTWVDVAAPLTFADYAAGRDPALATAVGYQPRASLLALIRKAVETGGAGQVRGVMETYRNDPANRYANIVQAIWDAAEAIDADKRTDLAFEVSEQGVRLFPASADTWYLHALLAEELGRKEAAATAAKRVLSIDPSNRNAVSLLERVQAPS
ncbi:hypothetical protein FPZ24_01410 [Sphingomonas panacisoli]|uniref:Uncharacterized protein n=1 Tax=Sphingomonas panacisoli TaxID=1813879 RepID=A0A5B8LEZ0_9SPHN|nr:hypothetical protein [Sphingomonas panacisoli]QDZ06294.1 hypothetical protein FPZ24_01410 [Sphingomonas panacisoli]